MPQSPMCNREDCCLSEEQLILQVQTFLRQKSRNEHPAGYLVAAWRWFYRDYSPLVRQIMSRSVPHNADQDDCFQQVWLSLLVLLPRLQFDPDRGSFRGWLVTVTHRLTRRFVRKLDRQQARVSIHIPEWEKIVAIRMSGPLQELQNSEQIDFVHQVLQQLRDRLSLPSYRVFHLRWIEGQSYDEIAKQLNLTSQQVRWRHHWAKQKAAELVALGEQFDVE